MPVFRSVASALLTRRAVKKLSRVIPNPLLRYVAVTAATVVVPLLIERGYERWSASRRRTAVA